MLSEFRVQGPAFLLDHGQAAIECRRLVGRLSSKPVDRSTR